MGQIVFGVDQGTSSTKAVALDATGQIRAQAQVAIGQATPRPGWVEQDPIVILDSVCACLDSLSAQCPQAPASVGLSNQRESALVWRAEGSQPLSALLGWQDRRTADLAQRLARDGVADEVRRRCGLPLDPMFSALKFSWLLDQVDPDRRLARAARLRLGTVDAWLVDRLTGQFRIEAGNAARTQLMNIETLDWDDWLLELFRVPRAALPEIVRSDQPSDPIGLLRRRGWETGFGAVLGDSHASLYGHGVRTAGTVKASYGTGSSIMGLLEEATTGRTASAAGAAAVPAPPSAGAGDPGLVRTLAWLTDRPARAFEGNILSSGGTLVWLARLLEASPSDLAQWAQSAPADDGLVLVPAFAGLGAPHWDPGAVAVLSGFDQGTGRPALARAGFESIAHQIEDVLARADQASGRPVDLVLADGGPSQNDWLMQLQADLSGRVVARPEQAQLSVAGVCQLAGIGAGLWDEAGLAAWPRSRREFQPSWPDDRRRRARAGWAKAVARARLRT
ncbi:MAG: hypothetical protein LBJ44_07530 [Propionibacteriaceae bacterium]|jgi:glycerol kinase|nr:hypothetical protein [Propionibacteriaceae bacterium]